MQATRGEIQLKHLEIPLRKWRLEDKCLQGILALSKTNACALSPSGTLCTQIFSRSTISEEITAQENRHY